MKGLQQEISKDTFMQEVCAEHRGNAKGFTSIWITENNTVALSEEDGLLGQVLNPYNLNRAYLQVCRNKGSHGVDGISVELLRDYLKQNGSDLIKQIKSGKYRPNPVNTQRRQIKTPFGDTYRCRQGYSTGGTSGFITNL